MTFNHLAVLKSLETLKFINKPDNIINLGVQTLTISSNHIKHIIKNNLCQQELFPQLIKLKEKFKNNKKVSTGDFFKTIGFSDYQSIDINEEENSLPFDLNTVIEDTYGYKKQYDLVINNGTGEHVFNQFLYFF